jgi:hypothetical protein
MKSKTFAIRLKFKFKHAIVAKINTGNPIGFSVYAMVNAMTTNQIQLRLRVYGSPQLSLQTLLQDLAESCRVVVRAIAQGEPPATFSVSTSVQSAALDVELSGPINAVQCWLSQLQRHPITIQGKGHASGDGWHY